MIDGHKFEQISMFQIVLHFASTRKALGDSITENFQSSSSATFKFLQTTGGYYIPVELELFKAKSIRLLLYFAQMGTFSNFASLELVQFKILISVLEVPKYVSFANLRLEIGLTGLEARVWMTILNYWLNLSLFHLCFTS